MAIDPPPATVGRPMRLLRTVRQRFDRPGRRWFLAGLMTVLVTITDRRWCHIRWTGTAWSYRYDGQTILSNQLLQPSQTFDPDLEIFLWDYQPEAGDVILDIGAGTGTEAVRLARAIGPTGRIIAVEAHPGTAAVLGQAGPVNGLSTITTVAAAVADVAGTVRISNDAQAGDNSIFRDGDIEVPATTIDDLIREHGLARVDFLKMNIEGAERLAVQGMAASVGKIDRLAISCHDFLGTEWGATRAEVTAWLTAHGYQVRTRPDDPRPWCRDYLYASRPSGAAGSAPA